MQHYTLMVHFNNVFVCFHVIFNYMRNIQRDVGGGHSVRVYRVRIIKEIERQLASTKIGIIRKPV